jgi:putative DNA primase/helicase
MSGLDKAAVSAAEMFGQLKPNGQAQPPGLLAASALKPRKVEWTWYPYVPANQISLIGGRGGSGKGLAGISAVAAVTAGRKWPDGSGPAEPGHAIWCEAEDPLEEVVIPRLMAAGADLSKVCLATRDAFHALDLRKTILENGTRLIVMSPMLSFLKDLNDKNNELHVRQVLETLQASIAGTRAAVLGICHTNKKADLAAIERLLGSVAFVNFVRSVLLVAPDTEDCTYRLAHAKHNLSVKGSDLLYRPKHVGTDPHSQFVMLDWWRPDSNVDADAMFDRKKGERAKSASQWLATYLRENGETPANDVIASGESAGYTREAINKAQYRNGRVQTRKDDFKGGWLWRLA